MNTLLINPPWQILRDSNVWKGVSSVMPPLGLAWLAASLEQDGHVVRILDANAEGFDLKDIMRWIAEHGPFEMFGLTSTTPLIKNALTIARAARVAYPTARIVLGGVHPTVLPDEVLAESAVDCVCRGEGEVTARELAAGLPFEQIKGLSWRRDGVVVHNPERELIHNLDSLPMPAYHLLPMAKYRPAAGAAKRTPATSLLATRGCPGRCTFCYRIFGQRLRYRSGIKVAAEVRHLQDRYGIKEICFYDDTFTAVKKETRAFCREVIDTKMDLTWSCFTRVDAFDEELFRLMKEAGCHQVMYGVETPVPEILRNINKKFTAEQVERVIVATKKIGLDVRATFMLGNPGDTEATLEENIRFAIKLDPDLALFNITTPFPGTVMFDWAEANGFLLTKDWADYDLSGPVMALPTVSPETVKRYYEMAHKRFYFRPRYILRRIWRLRSPEEFISAWRGLTTMLGF